jgi:GTP-binding protein
VGKSSLINMLTGRKKLAKISGTPGKTQLINHFIINENWYLVDLPGYGFAKISKSVSAKWEKMIENYLLHRKNLCATFLLIDSRLEPQKSDIDFINWFGEKELNFIILFTKSDKLSKSKLLSNLEKYKQVLLEWWDEPPISIATSAKTGTGKAQVLQLIEEMNSGLKK